PEAIRPRATPSTWVCSSAAVTGRQASPSGSSIRTRSGSLAAQSTRRSGMDISAGVSTSSGDSAWDMGWLLRQDGNAVYSLSGDRLEHVRPCGDKHVRSSRRRSVSTGGSEHGAVVVRSEERRVGKEGRTERPAGAETL